MAAVLETRSLNKSFGALKATVDVDFRPEGLVWILTAQRGMMERE